MPRLPRLDIAGLLQHVTARGIERRDIFLDDVDRKAFLDRLSTLLLKTGTDCLAWSLMDDHFHLLLRPQKTKLSLFMRRLLTGYAVTFNLRHHRVGPLFQSRYKSMVCEEKCYLLELVRYIHLDPVRTGLLPDVDALWDYPWTGHAVLTGKSCLEGQETHEILHRFAGEEENARPKYHAFVADAAGEGSTEGGSEASDKSTPLLRGKPEDEVFDGRILGSECFVEEILRRGEHEGRVSVVPLAGLITRVAAAYRIGAEDLCRPNKNRQISAARAAACYLATRVLNYRTVDLAKSLGITPAGVVIAARRGEAMVNTEEYQQAMGILNPPLEGEGPPGGRSLVSQKS